MNSKMEYTRCGIPKIELKVGNREKGEDPDIVREKAAVDKIKMMYKGEMKRTEADISDVDNEGTNRSMKKRRTNLSPETFATDGSSEPSRGKSISWVTGSKNRSKERPNNGDFVPNLASESPPNAVNSNFSESINELSNLGINFERKEDDSSTPNLKENIHPNNPHSKPIHSQTEPLSELGLSNSAIIFMPSTDRLSWATEPVG